MNEQEETIRILKAITEQHEQLLNVARQLLVEVHASQLNEHVSAELRTKFQALSDLVKSHPCPIAEPFADVKSDLSCFRNDSTKEFKEVRIECGASIENLKHEFSDALKILLDEIKELRAANSKSVLWLVGLLFTVLFFVLQWMK